MVVLEVLAAAWSSLEEVAFHPKWLGRPYCPTLAGLVEVFSMPPHSTHSAVHFASWAILVHKVLGTPEGNESRGETHLNQ